MFSACRYISLLCLLPALALADEVQSEMRTGDSQLRGLLRGWLPDALSAPLMRYTPLEPLVGAVDMLVDPETGALAPLTGQLNAVSSIGAGS